MVTWAIFHSHVKFPDVIALHPGHGTHGSHDRRSSHQKEIRCFGSSSMYIYIYMYIYMYIYIYISTYLYVYIYIYMCVCVYVSVWRRKGIRNRWETFIETSNDSPSPQPWRPWPPRVIHTGNTGCTMQWTQMSALSWPDVWPNFSHEMEMVKPVKMVPETNPLKKRHNKKNNHWDWNINKFHDDSWW